MKLGVFAMIPQLKAKVLNGSYQHHQKAKKFVFKSQKWIQCLCVSVTARELFTTSLSLKDKLSLDVFIWVLECLWKRIRYVRPEYSAPGSWFLFHNNAPVHRAVAVQEFLAQKQVCVLHHLPYSPDLSPCDYFLFPKLKLPLKGRLFEDVQDIQAAVTSSLHAIPQEDVQRSFQSLLDCATRCINAEGMCFELNTDSTQVFVPVLFCNLILIT